MPASRAVRKRVEDEVTSVERDSYAKIAQAVFAVEGDTAYPDGTFTLRLSYGQVQGFTENGREVPPFTEVRGLFVRADEHGMKPPEMGSGACSCAPCEAARRPIPMVRYSPSQAMGNSVRVSACVRDALAGRE